MCEGSSSAPVQSQYVLARNPAARGKAEGVLSFHQVELRGTNELGCTISQLLLSALNANFCVDIACQSIRAHLKPRKAGSLLLRRETSVSLTRLRAMTLFI